MSGTIETLVADIGAGDMRESIVLHRDGRGRPFVLIEYKERHARVPNLQHATYRALAALASGYREGPLPFAVARYCPDAWWFVVTPADDAVLSRLRADLPVAEAA